MKILSVRLHNLNSLKGEHLVQFDSEPLASAGLFAITGPTGAGKTTLLDAITLALYGKVARYGSESNPEHVMTRHCGECSAEVEFQVTSGVYRAAWERHRAGKKPEGKLQPPKRYIYNAAGEPLAQQIREAEEKIRNLLGLNYDQFLRSVLLAQGDFARFLKADANERASLLESLTGTDVYSRLGKLAHEEANRLEADLNARAIGLAQIELLEKEERTKLKTAIKDGEAQNRKLSKNIEDGAEMIALIGKLKEARAREKSARLVKANLVEEKQETADDISRLKRHRATLPFTKALSELTHAEAAFEEADQKNRAALKNHKEAKAEKEHASLTLHTSIDAALEQATKEQAAAKQIAEEATREAAEAQKWLKSNQADGDLAEQRPEIVSAIDELRHARKDAGRTWLEWKRSAVVVAQDEAAGLPENWMDSPIDQLRAQIDKAVAAGEERQALLKEAGIEAKRQLELRRDHLEKTKLVASFDQHRNDLQPDEECPLCGSTHHPFAEGGAANTGFHELEVEVRNADAQLEKAREEFRNLTDNLKHLKSDRDQLFQMIVDTVERTTALEHLLQPLSTPVPAPGGESELKQTLQNRAKAFRDKEKQFESASGKKDGASASAKLAAEQVSTLSEKQSKLGAKPETSPGEIFPLPVSEAEEAFLEAVQSEKVAASQSADRMTDAKALKAKLDEVNASVNQAVSESAFNSLSELREANLSEDEASRIESQEASLNERSAAAEALLKQAVNEVKTLTGKKVLEGDEASTFTEKHRELKQQREQLLQEQTTRKNTLTTDDLNRKRKEESEKELEEDRKRFAVWRRLKELIGSHDGAKFRRHAQSISLDILTRHANRHLIKLSDRYRIQRDLEGELNLEIEDLHQAGAKRPMASLSGGESFLASLALALGLSDLAGRNVRIDSLFIDEGFGSLDPDSLEVAIATLESLQQDQKTVGVISHVDLLKERIGTQVIVEKQPGGVSEIRLTPSE